MVEACCSHMNSHVIPIDVELLREISCEVIDHFRRASHAYPLLSWASSASPGMISDGIAAELARRMGLEHRLDGVGEDVPQLNLEITAGKSVMKGHPHKLHNGPARFLWLRRMNPKSACGGWAGKIEVRFGILDPGDFGRRPDEKQKDYHGVSVPKQISLDKLRVVLEIQPDPEAQEHVIISEL
jgi:hypothetical protein